MIFVASILLMGLGIWLILSVQADATRKLPPKFRSGREARFALYEFIWSSPFTTRDRVSYAASKLFMAIGFGLLAFGLLHGHPQASIQHAAWVDAAVAALMIGEALVTILRHRKAF